MAGKSTRSRAAAEPKTPGQEGRSRAVIDLEQLAELAGLQCTQEEAAAVLKVDKRTLQRRLVDDPIAAEAWERGRANGRTSLRRIQWKLALRGHPTMLVWLGKQYLAQRDKFEHTGEGGGPIRHVNEVDPGKLSTETLRQLRNELAEVKAREGDGLDDPPLPPN